MFGKVVLYGRGAASVGEQIKKSREEAQEIIDKFFNAFPSVKKWIDQSIETAHKKGYVEDVAGRRRRLPLFPRPRPCGHPRFRRNAGFAEGQNAGRPAKTPGALCKGLRLAGG